MLIKSSRKRVESQEPSRPDLPFVKSMTQEELEKYSTEELMKTIIERELSCLWTRAWKSVAELTRPLIDNPEYAESRCQLHSAITAVRSAVAQRTPPAKDNHLRSSTDLTRTSISSTLSWLAAPSTHRCQYSVCAECAPKDTDRVYLGQESVITEGSTCTAPAAAHGLPRPRLRPSSATRKPRKFSRKMAEIRWSEGGPMVSLWDLDVFYHGLTGNGWRVPKWTRPRNMLRTPRKLKAESREGSTSASSSPRPVARGHSVFRAKAHGFWE